MENLRIFRKHCPQILRQQILLETTKEYLTEYLGSGTTNNFEARKPSLKRFHGVLLFLDCVGFTSLAQKLDIESLKNQINEYFTLMLSIVEKWGGDVVKFAGDALYIIWTIRVSDAEEEEEEEGNKNSDESDEDDDLNHQTAASPPGSPYYKRAGSSFTEREAVQKAVSCALEVAASCSHYEIVDLPPPPQTSSSSQHPHPTAPTTTGTMTMSSSGRLHGSPKMSYSPKKIVPYSFDQQTPSGQGQQPQQPGHTQPGQEEEAAVYLNVRAGISIGLMAAIDLGGGAIGSAMVVGGIGAGHDRWEFFLAGRPLTEVAQAEAIAAQGQVMVSQRVHAIYHHREEEKEKEVMIAAVISRSGEKQLQQRKATTEAEKKEEEEEEGQREEVEQPSHGGGLMPLLRRPSASAIATVAATVAGSRRGSGSASPSNNNTNINPSSQPSAPGPRPLRCGCCQLLHPATTMAGTQGHDGEGQGGRGWQPSDPSSQSQQRPQQQVFFALLAASSSSSSSASHSLQQELTASSSSFLYLPSGGGGMITTPSPSPGPGPALLPPIGLPSAGPPLLQRGVSLRRASFGATTAALQQQYMEQQLAMAAGAGSGGGECSGINRSRRGSRLQQLPAGLPGLQLMQPPPSMQELSPMGSRRGSHSSRRGSRSALMAGPYGGSLSLLGGGENEASMLARLQLVSEVEDIVAEIDLIYQGLQSVIDSIYYSRILRGRPPDQVQANIARLKEEGGQQGRRAQQRGLLDEGMAHFLSLQTEDQARNHFLLYMLIAATDELIRHVHDVARADFRFTSIYERRLYLENLFNPTTLAAPAPGRQQLGHGLVGEQQLANSAAAQPGMMNRSVSWLGNSQGQGQGQGIVESNQIIATVDLSQPLVDDNELDKLFESPVMLKQPSPSSLQTSPQQARRKSSLKVGGRATPTAGGGGGGGGDVLEAAGGYINEAELRSVTVMFIKIEGYDWQLMQDVRAPAEHHRRNSKSSRKNSSHKQQAATMAASLTAGSGQANSNNIDKLFGFLARSEIEKIADDVLLNHLQCSMDILLQKIYHSGGQLRQFMNDDKET